MRSLTARSRGVAVLRRGTGRGGETQLVAPERLQAGLELLAAEMRRRCRERYALPEDEHVIWNLVSGGSWAGTADYLGQRATRVRINVDLPISSPRLLELVCHEAYPGHHTESVCKDASLIRPAGRDEFSVFVYPSPQAVMSEGLASHAIEALLGPDAERVAADCLQQAGIAYDHETAVAVREAETLLLSVRSNVALLLDRGTPSPIAREYARAWLLDDTGQIDKAITNLEARTWRPYESCYPVGLTLCRHYAATDQQRFCDLLHMQLTPRDIAT